MFSNIRASTIFRYIWDYLILCHSMPLQRCNLTPTNLNTILSRIIYVKKKCIRRDPLTAPITPILPLAPPLTIKLKIVRRGSGQGRKHFLTTTINNRTGTPWSYLIWAPSYSIFAYYFKYKTFAFEWPLSPQCPNFQIFPLRFRQIFPEARMSTPRTTPMEVLCLGLCRTGTQCMQFSSFNINISIDNT